MPCTFLPEIILCKEREQLIPCCTSWMVIAQVQLPQTAAVQSRGQKSTAHICDQAARQPTNKQDDRQHAMTITKSLTLSSQM